MILILSREDDEHVPYVTTRLESRKAEYVWFNPARFPAASEITVEFDRTRGISRRTLKYDGGHLDFSTVTGVWYRRPQSARAAETVTDPQIREWVSRESQHVLAGVWETLDCTWIPGKPSDVARAENKLYQLALAARLGFAIPRTVIGNSPESLRAVYSESEGQMVTKAAEPEVFSQGERYFTGYTHVVNRRDLANHSSLRLAPAIMQEYIPKRVELRVNVVGARVLAAEIHSQDTASTRYDWRRYDLDRTPHLPHQLPPAVEARCVELVRALRLSFGAIDLIVTPSGEYVFVEINANGQWGWIQDLTGLPIADAIVDLLVAGGATATDGGLRQFMR